MGVGGADAGVAALAATPAFPQVRAAMSLTSGGSARDGEVVDER
jgi:hypothetical protein